MLNSFPRIPATIPASRRKLIQVVRGQLVMLDLSKRKLEEVHAYLLGDIDLPPDPIPTAANDNRLPMTGGEVADADAPSDQSSSLEGEVQ